MNRLINPILPGYYPDPSICRVGDDYYLACSSFELYPGIPIFHSRDLANWEKIANAASGSGFVVHAWAGLGGAMAPTIRHHNGTFYIINANMNHGGNCNYIITAADPAGPWSEPVYLPDVPNIDASIFFDDDGACYIIGTGLTAETPAGSRERCIWAAPFDLDSMRLAARPVPIWDSALRGASSPEAPHIYKKDGWYYLLIAEGGTEHYHSITVARSRTPLGWYEGSRANPILTHRHLGKNHPVGNVGHGDLVETPDGRWYCVMLASRLVDGCHKNLGRETFICPVEWEDGWPVLCPGKGRVMDSYPMPDAPWHPFPALPEREDFVAHKPGLDWVFWGTPREEFHRMEDSRLYLRCLPRTLDMDILPLRPDRTPEARYHANVSGLFRRQTHMDFDAAAAMTFRPEGGESAGIAMVQAINHTLRVERALDGGCQVVRAVLTGTRFNHPPFIPGYDGHTQRTLLAQAEWDGQEIVLAFRVRRQVCHVLYGKGEHELQVLCTVDLRRINPEYIAGMTGTMLGMFASGNGGSSLKEAAFDWMDYRPM